MKTGRLVKLQRPGGEVHAYFYREDGLYLAAMYLYRPDRSGELLPTITGPTEANVEAAVRDWVEKNYPRG
jgi:hypothetical protein